MDWVKHQFTVVTNAQKGCVCTKAPIPIFCPQWADEVSSNFEAAQYAERPAQISLYTGMMMDVFFADPFNMGQPLLR